MRLPINFVPEIDETDNEDMGADADIEDEEMTPSQEQQEQVERS